MNKYIIYHPKGGLINHQCLRGQYQYEAVGTVTAHSVEDAFLKGQNDYHPYSEFGVRSTCVGDIICCQDNPDSVFPTCYMIRGMGYDIVPHTVITYQTFDSVGKNWWTELPEPDDDRTPTVVGKIDLPEPKRKHTLHCDDCSSEVDDSFGDPREEIKFIQVDGEGNETIEVMKVCTYCIHDKYWGLRD